MGKSSMVSLGGKLKTKIYNFFGWDVQMEKADEELKETNVAMIRYNINPTTENMVAWLDEIGDQLNVASGIAEVKHSVNMSEIESFMKIKQMRTIRIIRQIPKGLSYKEKIKEYERIRKL
ncbi:hypothetical protein N9924_00970 [bacterium]|nr:hypothetical protein [bacterium]